MLSLRFSLDDWHFGPCNYQQAKSNTYTPIVNGKGSSFSTTNTGG